MNEVVVILSVYVKLRVCACVFVLVCRHTSKHCVKLFIFLWGGRDICNVRMYVV